MEMAKLRTFQVRCDRKMGSKVACDGENLPAREISSHNILAT